MAYAFVQQIAGTDATTDPNVSSGNLPGSVTSGNLLWWVVGYTGTTTIQSFSDTRGFTFTEVGSIHDAVSDYSLRWGYAKVTGSGTESLTINLVDDEANKQLYLAEYSGLDATTPFTSGEIASARDETGTSGTDGISTGNTPTLAAQPAMLVGFSFNLTQDVAPNAGTGFTSRTAVGFGGASSRPEDKRLTSTTAVSATFTGLAADVFISCAAVFKESGAATGVPKTTKLTLLGVG